MRSDWERFIDILESIEKNWTLYSTWQARVWNGWTALGVGSTPFTNYWRSCQSSFNRNTKPLSSNSLGKNDWYAPCTGTWLFRNWSGYCLVSFGKRPFTLKRTSSDRNANLVINSQKKRPPILKGASYFFTVVRSLVQYWPKLIPLYPIYQIMYHLKK